MKEARRGIYLQFGIPLGELSDEVLQSVDEILRETLNRREVYRRIKELFTQHETGVGAGKTTLVRKMIDDLKKSRMVVSESMSIEKERVNLTSLVNALYMDFGEKAEKERESRDRKLFQLIEKHSRRVVLFVDDAHNLPYKTLFGLKALVEKGLCVVLVGHPRLAFNLKRGLMEEIGMRCECLELPCTLDRRRVTLFAKRVTLYRNRAPVNSSIRIGACNRPIDYLSSDSKTSLPSTNLTGTSVVTGTA